MILLVTPSERARDCAAAIHEVTGEEVVIAESLGQATTRLRSEVYLAVVLDQYLLETEGDEAGSASEHLGTAILVQVNLGISGMDRLVREVRAALQRRRREEARARQAATGQLHSELSGTITALLLSTELAMEIPDLSLAATERLESVHVLMKKLRRQFENASTAESHSSCP
jgi:hypothetical protein